MYYCTTVVEAAQAPEMCFFRSRKGVYIHRRPAKVLDLYETQGCQLLERGTLLLRFKVLLCSLPPEILTDKGWRGEGGTQ